MIKWDLVTLRVDELFEHPKNARILTKQKEKHLRESLEKFGLVDKIIINTDMTIIGGHQRLRILNDMGESSVECLMPSRDLTDAEVDELNIRLNKNTGEWDYDKLANEWDINFLVEWGFSVKEFHDEGKGVEVKKPRVTIEFDNREALEESMNILNELQSNCKCKVKLKVS